MSKLTKPQKRLLIELSEMNGTKTCDPKSLPEKVQSLIDLGFVQLNGNQLSLTHTAACVVLAVREVYSRDN